MLAFLSNFQSLLPRVLGTVRLSTVHSSSVITVTLISQEQIPQVSLWSNKTANLTF